MRFETVLSLSIFELLVKGGVKKRWLGGGSFERDSGILLVS